MSPVHPEHLLALWRDRARALESYGDPSCARLWVMAADELARALAMQADATLTLREAAERTGYTADHLGSLIKRGRIPNVGKKGAPRIRVSDLPPKKNPRGPGRRARLSRVSTDAEMRRRLLTQPLEDSTR